MKTLKFFTLLIFTLLTFTLLITSCQDDLLKEQEFTDEKIDLRQVTLEDWEPIICPDILIYIEDCGDGWTGGIEAAVDAYNAVNSGITMGITGSATGADIVVTCVDILTSGISGLVGLGEWPSTDFTVGGQVYLNTDYDNCADPCFFQGFAMHEIGHNLGFGHNNHEGVLLYTGVWTYNPVDGLLYPTGPQTTAIGEQIPGTPTTDGNSVFNEFIGGCGQGTNCIFTDADIDAIQYLYPEDCNVECTTKCPTVEVTKMENSSGECHWKVFITNDSDCEFYFDITNPPPFNSSTENVIPANDTYFFETGTIGCSDGPIIIEIYGIDAEGNRFDCETLELECCDPVPCIGCPEVELTKIETGEGCSRWDVTVTNNTECNFILEINNPGPNPSTDIIVVSRESVIVIPTVSICCEDGPIIINVYTIDANDVKHYCDPIVLSSCDEECEGMEECLEVGFREHFECQLRAYFNECGAFTNGNSSFTWLTPFGTINGGIFVTADVDGVYCVTVTFQNGCVLTDCIIVKGCIEDDRD